MEHESNSCQMVFQKVTGICFRAYMEENNWLRTKNYFLDLVHRNHTSTIMSSVFVFFISQNRYFVSKLYTQLSLLALDVNLIVISL